MFDTFRCHWKYTSETCDSMVLAIWASTCSNRPPGQHLAGDVVMCEGAARGPVLLRFEGARGAQVLLQLAQLRLLGPQLLLLQVEVVRSPPVVLPHPAQSLILWSSSAPLSFHSPATPSPELPSVDMPCAGMLAHAVPTHWHCEARRVDIERVVGTLPARGVPRSARLFEGGFRSCLGSTCLGCVKASLLCTSPCTRSVKRVVWDAMTIPRRLLLL